MRGMMTIDWRSRGKAALIHLGGSALIASISAVLVFKLWYPWPFSVLAGGTGLFLLITGVDVTLGPVLTFAVFDRRKTLRHLVIDLSIIVGVQLGALGYGLQTMIAARPVALALETDRFRVVRANDIDPRDLERAPEAMRSLPLSGPTQVWTAKPTTSAEQFEAIQYALAGADVGMRPQYWRAWDDVGRSEVMLAAKPSPDLAKILKEGVADLDAAMAATGLPKEQIGYLTVLSHKAEWVALVDRKKGEVVGFAPVIAP